MAKRTKNYTAYEDVDRDLDYQFDVNINITIELDGNTWADLLEAYDNDLEAALGDIADDLEGANIDSIYGSAWVCSVDQPDPLW